MKPIVEFEECLCDSPKFRSCLEESENDIDLLETKLERLVKLCSSMVEAGKAYMSTKVLFINGIWDLVLYYNDDTMNRNALNKLIQPLQEMDKYQSILIDQAKRTVCNHLSKFIQTDIKRVKETKRVFEKASDEFDQALTRNSQAPRSKSHECEEVNNVVTAARSGFQHTALDYVFQLSMLQAKKRYEVLDTLLSYTHAHSTFFHQGTDLCQDVEPFMKQLANTLAQFRDQAHHLERAMEERHVLVGSKDTVKKGEDGVVLEGYLFKRTSNAFKSWKRRWFMIKNHQLVYRKRLKDETVTVMEVDLRLCTVKPVTEGDRRFCFEMVSPLKQSAIKRHPSKTKKSRSHASAVLITVPRCHVLQADSEEMYNLWVSSLQSGIDAALHHSMHGSNSMNNSSCSRDNIDQLGSEHHSSNTESASSPRSPNLWEELSSISGNERCADCGSLLTQWASINLGITLCIECSGIHRGLGVHHSKVRSLRLDEWDPDLVKLMKQLGNTFVNKVYEANVGDNVVRATPECPNNVREAWIRAKYVQKAFISKGPSVNNNKAARLVRKGSVRRAPRSRHRAPPQTEPAGASPDLLGEGAGEIGIPGEMRREKKNSIVVSSPEFHARRAAVLFEEVSRSVPSGLARSGRGDPSGPASLDPLHDPVRNRVSASLKTRSYSVDDASSAIPSETIAEKVASMTVSPKGGSDADDDRCSADEEDGTWCTDGDANLHLYKAATNANLRQMFVALAHGADINWCNVEDDESTPVHKTISSGSLLASEYLFLNGAKIDSKDVLGRAPLHLAADLGYTGLVCLLLKRCADQKAKDGQGRDALYYAVNNANADIVTLLRLAQLNEDMKESEFGGQDETFNEVVRDFSQRASNFPDKHKRPSVGSSNSSQDFTWLNLKGFQSQDFPSPKLKGPQAGCLLVLSYAKDARKASNQLS